MEAKAMTIPEALQIAVRHHEGGNLPAAEGIYRKILSIQPNHSDTLHMLGVLAHQTGRQEEAADLIGQAIAADPADAFYQINFGNVLRAQGNTDRAIAAFRHALEINPDNSDGWYNLGTTLRDKGVLNEAIAAFQEALRIQPDYLEAYINLGTTLKDSGRLDEAIAAYRAAIELKPDLAMAHNNLGAALQAKGRLEEAARCYHRMTQIDRDNADAWYNLGTTLRDLARPDEAIAALRQALRIKPDYSEAHNNLGSALKDMGQLDEAITAFRRALQPGREDARLHSNLIYTLHYHPDYDERKMSEEHARWNRLYSEPLKEFIQPHLNDRSPERRLKIGYVSPDFYNHAECYFLFPLLEAHDHTSFEIHAYASVLFPDAYTERFRKSFDVWHDVRSLSDAALAEQIRKDGIDVLIDLTMHTRDNRLPVFCRQPAPVQVSWLAYPGTTGVPGFGYRFADHCVEPPNEETAYSQDLPIRLPSWCCYLPVGDSPEVGPLPALSTKQVTFGSLNNFCKVNSSVLTRWGRLLDAVDGSRLLMRCPEGPARERVLGFFMARGIAEERLELVGNSPRFDYLALYNRIDIGLDPFPFNGITTTLDALWMGVPVLTLPGEVPTSRATLSFLASMGLGELVADSEKDYVRIGVELAQDLGRLSALRSALRPRMQASPLMDGVAFARNVENAYREMWRAWCSK